MCGFRAAVISFKISFTRYLLDMSLPERFYQHRLHQRQVLLTSLKPEDAYSEKRYKEDEREENFCSRLQVFLEHLRVLLLRRFHQAHFPFYQPHTHYDDSL